MRSYQQNFLTDDNSETIVVKIINIKRYHSLKALYEDGPNTRTIFVCTNLFLVILTLGLFLHFYYRNFCYSDYTFIVYEFAHNMNKTSKKVAYGYDFFPLKLLFPD